ncbi:hypothetical protein ACPCVO_47790 [Streptomyces umbrinus]
MTATRDVSVSWQLAQDSRRCGVRAETPLTMGSTFRPGAEVTQVAS